MTACRGTLAPRTGVAADYNADSHMGPVSGSTPTAAEVSQLQFAAFQAVLDHQEARKQNLTTANASATHASEHAALAPVSAVAPCAAVMQCHAGYAVHAADAGHAEHAAQSLEAPLSATVAENRQQPLLTSGTPSVQHPLPSADRQNAHAGGSDIRATEHVLDADDIQLETDGREADRTACLLPCSEVNDAEASSSTFLEDSASASTLSWNASTRAMDPACANDNLGAAADAADSSKSLAAIADAASTSGRMANASEAGSQKCTHLNNSDLCFKDMLSHTDRQQGGSNFLGGFDKVSALSTHKHEQSVTAGLIDHSGHVRESEAPPWYQHGSLAASTAASDSSHDTFHDTPASLIAAVPALATTATAAANGLERETSVTDVSTSLHSLGHFHISPSQQFSSAADGALASSPIFDPVAPDGPPPLDPPPGAQQQESESSAAKGNTAAAEKQPTVSRVMSKLHSLQSMTNR